ncbi:MAG: dipeptide epimerase [Verrucomicrobia subdivision 3 bacterium]|nr:dipeptide epimerase [Limisphaerales bacterium]
MQLKFWRFDLKLVNTWRIASGLAGAGGTTYPVVFVELSDAQGRKGTGESAPSSRYNETTKTVEGFLKQVDAKRLSFNDVPGSMHYLDQLERDNDAAKTALNLALLDGAARQRDLPIYDYLKLGFTEKRHVTSFSIGIDTPEVVRRKVQEAAAYPVMKLKVGSPDDEKNLAALRSVAPTKRVRVDANEAWQTRDEALRRIEWLARDKNIEFIEQPMPASAKRSAMSWLKERSPIPIFADESCQHVSDVEHCGECFHGVNVKLVKAGGISGAFAALTAARRAGLKTMIGCMIESSVLISAAAHLAELADHLDIDGNLLISNDPYVGATAHKGVISFADAPERAGLRVQARTGAS